MAIDVNKSTEPPLNIEIWCRRSGRAEIWDAQQGWVLKEPVMETVPDSQGRGLTFLGLDVHRNVGTQPNKKA